MPTTTPVSYTHLDVYKRQALGDPYKAADETYYKILVPEKNSKGKGVRKGYLWVVVGINTRMIYLLYDDGSRSEKVILNELGGCKAVSYTHLGRRQNHRYQYSSRRRLSDKRHLLGDERHYFTSLAFTHTNRNRMILIRQPTKPITKYSSRKRTAREKESARDTFGWLWA